MLILKVQALGGFQLPKAFPSSIAGFLAEWLHFLKAFARGEGYFENIYLLEMVKKKFSFSYRLDGCNEKLDFVIRQPLLKLMAPIC